MTKRQRTAFEWALFLLELIESEDETHALGSMMETVYSTMESLKVPLSMRDEIYSHFKNLYWQERQNYQGDPEEFEPQITPPTTPKPDEASIPNCISGTIRAAGSGRWLADVLIEGKARTIYVDQVQQ